MKYDARRMASYLNGNSISNSYESVNQIEFIEFVTEKTNISQYTVQFALKAGTAKYEMFIYLINKMNNPSVLKLIKEFNIPGEIHNLELDEAQPLLTNENKMSKLQELIKQDSFNAELIEKVKEYGKTLSAKIEKYDEVLSKMDEKRDKKFGELVALRCQFENLEEAFEEQDVKTLEKILIK